MLVFLGAPFVAAPAIGWILVLYLCKKWWQQTNATPPEERITIPLAIWVWIGCMSVIAVALVVGHFSFDLGLVKTIKSFINFFLRTWALLVVFPLIGCLNIRPQLLYRAVSILCLQALILIPIAYALATIGVEMPLYNVSLMAKIGGNSERFYNVSLYLFEEGSVRLLLGAPWAPALAFLANVLFCLTSQDSDRRWRWIGMISCALMVWGSASRLGLICLIALPFLKVILVSLSRPLAQISAGIVSFTLGIFSPQLIQLAQDFKDQFTSQRASSSRVRGTLARMAIHRWQDEPIWGHAVKAVQGPEVVQFMPLGSHQTWLGILYVHGIVGFVALLFAMLYSFIDLVIKAQRSQTAQTGLAILIVLFLFSMGENLETLAYLYYPGLIMLGIAFKGDFKGEKFPAHITA